VKTVVRHFNAVCVWYVCCSCRNQSRSVSYVAKRTQVNELYSAILMLSTALSDTAATSTAAAHVLSTTIFCVSISGQCILSIRSNIRKLNWLESCLYIASAARGTPGVSSWKRLFLMRVLIIGIEIFTVPN
jgi:hypothetical protein